MSPSKRKTPAHETNNQNDKGKGRDREFQLVTSEMVVSVAPVFAVNPRAGVEELLDSLVMRYIPALQGVVLAHSNLKFTSDTGNVKDDCPFIICNIRFDATIWNPRMGMKLKGRINLSSPDHISLLVHRTFNVSIPRHHIPAEEWEFEYGPAENDPEFANAEEEEEKEDDEEKEEKAEGDAEAVEEDTTEHDSGNGRWVHRSTGERLGGPSGILEFTVIGLTVANEMLSLVASLQDDPFSPIHRPYSSATSSPVAKKKTRREEPQPEEDAEDPEEADSEDEDGFSLLKRKAETPVEEAPETVAKPTKKKRKAKKEKE
ncbi:hypothetical protein DFP72DRAFT_874248 [Ephemerocybe angulata]|uniref:RPA43 OB domain-containing protein n=1 Tax=Ephemerocybe angulata TaxID=980116 RepID=A0A8H6IEG0_9AGAR|nr:hypothetical protein DFP72DRAFT_874248 [Tulosesus angulatus]